MFEALIGMMLEKSIKKNAQNRNEQTIKNYHRVLDMITDYCKKYPSVKFTLLSRLEPINEKSSYGIEITNMCIMNPQTFYEDPLNPKDYQKDPSKFLIRIIKEDKNSKKYSFFFAITMTMLDRNVDQNVIINQRFDTAYRTITERANKDND